MRGYCATSQNWYIVLMKKNIVRDSLDEFGLSPSDFARLVGVTPRAVSLWLNGQREVPGPVGAYAKLLKSLPPHLRRREIESTLAIRKNTMRPAQYKFMLWQLISACDSGKYDTLSIEEVQKNADAGTISSFMIEKFGSDCDFSIFEAKDWIVINDTWGSIANAIDSRRKFGVEKRGICLLLAYALESLQMLSYEATDV